MHFLWKWWIFQPVMLINSGVEQMPSINGSPSSPVTRWCVMLAIPLDAGGRKFRGTKSWTSKPQRVGSCRDPKNDPTFPWKPNGFRNAEKKSREVWGWFRCWLILFPFGEWCLENKFRGSRKLKKWPILFDDLSFFKVQTLKADGSGADMPLDVRNAIQFLAFCLRDKAELKLNFKHVAAWRYSVSSGDC